MADEAKVANEEKLNFFTNISHELKTPLTLILAPAEEALHNPKLSVTGRNQFGLIKKCYPSVAARKPVDGFQKTGVKQNETGVTGN